MNEEIERVLGGFYEKTEILSVSADKIEDDFLKVSFYFPRYRKTKEKLGHVSDNQINQAILEGLYLSMNDYLQSKENISLDLEIMKEDVIREKSYKYHLKESGLPEESQQELNFKVTKYKNIRNRFVSVRFTIEGFIEGYVDCALKI